MTWWFAVLLVIFFLATFLASDLRRRRERVVSPRELGLLIDAGREKTKASRGIEPSRRGEPQASGAYHRL